MMESCPMWIPYCVYWFIKKGEESMNSNMRKMYTEEEVAELIRKYVLSGDIEIGGDLIVIGSINGEESPSVKPIYWHSLTLKRINSDPELIYYFDFVILNNSATPFTLATFQEWLNQHEGAEIKTVQGYDRSHKTNLVSFFCREVGEIEPNTITITSINLSTGEPATTRVYVTADGGATLTDNGVNKIN